MRWLLYLIFIADTCNLLLVSILQISNEWLGLDKLVETLKCTEPGTVHDVSAIVDSRLEIVPYN